MHVSVQNKKKKQNYDTILSKFKYLLSLYRYLLCLDNLTKYCRESWPTAKVDSFNCMILMHIRQLTWSCSEIIMGILRQLFLLAFAIGLASSKLLGKFAVENELIFNTIMDFTNCYPRYRFGSLNML